MNLELYRDKLPGEIKRGEALRHGRRAVILGCHNGWGTRRAPIGAEHAADYCVAGQGLGDRRSGEWPQPAGRCNCLSWGMVYEK